MPPSPPQPTRSLAFSQMSQLEPVFSPHVSNLRSHVRRIERVTNGREAMRIPPSTSFFPSRSSSSSSLATQFTRILMISETLKYDKDFEAVYVPHASVLIKLNKQCWQDTVVHGKRPRTLDLVCTILTERLIEKATNYAMKMGTSLKVIIFGDVEFIDLSHECDFISDLTYDSQRPKWISYLYPISPGRYIQGKKAIRLIVLNLQCAMQEQF
ncbi:hypothetical protein HZH68_000816 [Vespula germanica]|uniref:Uncharacterized protein n=1 Tax=Vespula germanica TaxID=30212 RepID=A0A834NUA5_VESGE|nr:hypothetical protein HZH68_000816 [Vespula germanica]